MNSNLQEEIDKARREISTDGYKMSVGEFVNMYTADDLILQPAFQRYYRWEISQKSRLIESLLLGIPVPSLFVFQKNDGEWELIDGLQRTSTILEFMGLLKDENGETVPPLKLESGEYLENLNGIYFSKEFIPANDPDGKALTAAQQRFLKRAPLDIKIIERESSDSAKFDLFNRLNAGGYPLTDQEIRSAQTVMISPEFHSKLVECSNAENFKETTSLSDKQISEQYDLELIARFICFKDLNDNDFKEFNEISSSLTKLLSAKAKQFDSSSTDDFKVFDRVFSTIYSATNGAAFKRYDPQQDRFLGGFTIAAYEAITLGLAHNIDDWEKISNPDRDSALLVRIKDILKSPEYIDGTKAGTRGTTRLSKIVPYSREFFKVK